MTPPGLYVTLAVIVALTTLIYWQRQPVKGFLRRLRLKEIAVGPVKLEQKEANEGGEPAAGVRLRGDFRRAKIEGLAGRDIVRREAGLRPGSETAGGITGAVWPKAGLRPGGETPGVELDGEFADAEVRDVAGRDRIEGQQPPGSEPPAGKGDNR